MSSAISNVAVLGSTGSIGQSALDVIGNSAGRFRLSAISAHRRLDEAVQQAKSHQPRWLVATCPETSGGRDWSDLPTETKLLFGQDGIEQIATDPETDVVVSAIVGAAGLRGTWAALKAGKRVALANKETLVMGGPLVTDLAKQHNGALIPVDSEHSAIFQALSAGKDTEVSKVMLTASGGPFLRYTKKQLEEVTVEQALNHPTWDMGPKITVDSATMMNKALEVIEARWLFDLPAEKIGVVVHPQSIVHSLVEYVDGSVIAQMSPPDMRLPIQYALSYPERCEGVARKMNWNESFQLDFEPPDTDRFPALLLGHEAAKNGGTTGAVLNAANEAAVQGFLDGQIKFNEIVPACRAVLDHHQFDAQPSLEELLEIDAWARQEVTRWVCT